MSLKDELVAKMRSLGIEPKRSLGQNFLISEHIVERIFDYIERRQSKFIVEVGPGLGALTERLIERRIPRKIVELDRKFAEYWTSRGEDVIEVDALELDWAKLALPPGTLLLGNLPYQIGSRLTIEISMGPPEIEFMLLMFQKEVALRLMAEPRSKDYGFLTVVAQTFWNIDKIVDASSQDFYPAPNVSSRVISFKRRKMDERFNKDFIAFVKTAFQFRRKFMLKAFTREEAATYERILRTLDIKNTVRAEELNPAQFQRIFLMKNHEAGG